MLGDEIGVRESIAAVITKAFQHGRIPHEGRVYWLIPTLLSFRWPAVISVEHKIDGVVL